MLPLASLFSLSLLVVVGGRPLGNGCNLPLDVLNRLVSNTIEEDTFGVEPVVGLGTQQGGSIDDSIEEMLNAILKANSTYSREQLKPCVEAYLKIYDKPQLPGSNVDKPVGGLNYHTPWYLGGSTGIGVPVPDDEEYKPGSEGYTTYINPYNFLKKASNYVPSAMFSYNDIFKFLSDAFGKARIDLNKVLEVYTPELPDLDSWF